MLTGHRYDSRLTPVAVRENYPDGASCEIPLRPWEIAPEDEHANFLTHGFGFVLSLFGAIGLLNLAWNQPDWGLSVACLVYSLSLVSLYAASTLSHAYSDPKRRRFYRTVDQACIFLLISGSFTPFAAAYMAGGFGVGLIVVMWALALIGAYLVFYWGYLSGGAQRLYVAMGWLPAIGMPAIINQAPAATVGWIVAGGLLYTAGTYFLWRDHTVKYFHAVWHLFVVLGSTAHYIAIVSLL